MATTRPFPASAWRRSARLWTAYGTDIPHLKRSTTMRRLAIAMALSTSAGLAQAAGPHVHGQGNLDLAMAGGTLLVELSLPAADVVGFEHAPRDDDQKALVKDALARLGKGTNVLEPAPAAACKVTRESVHSGLSDSETEEHDHGEESPDHDADHDHDHDHDHG